MAVVVMGSPLHWITRFTQRLGLVYMCVAVFSSLRERTANGIPLAAIEESWQGTSFMEGFRKQSLLGWVLRYVLAILAVAAAFGLRVAVETWIGSGLPIFITFYPAVMVVALLAGFGPGLVSTALVGFTVAYWVMPPIGQFAIESPVDRVAMLIFAGMGLFICGFADSIGAIGKKRLPTIARQLCVMPGRGWRRLRSRLSKESSKPTQDE